MSNVWVGSNSFLDPTKIGTAIAITSPDITVTSIVNNFAPDIPKLIQQRNYTIPDASTPQRQISGFKSENRTALLAADTTSSSTTSADITGLSAQLCPNSTYRVDGTFAWRSSIKTAGAAFGFCATGSPFSYLANCTVSTSQDPAAPSAPVAVATRSNTDVGTPSTQVDTAGATMLATCTATIQTQSGGALVGRVKASSSGTTIKVLAGSSMTVREIRPQNY